MQLSFHVSCSTILAAALADLFPDSKRLGFSGTEDCFYCDFTLPFPFRSEMVKLLEDRMRDWIKKKLPFVVKEMVSANAVKFLEHQGLFDEAEQARYSGSLVSLIELGHFVSLSPGDHLTTTAEIKFFKLSSVKHYNGWIRLIGTAAASKETLASKNFPSHLDLVEELHLLKRAGDGWVWLPNGEHLKSQLIEKAYQLFSDLDFITTPAGQEETAHLNYVKTTGRSSWEMIKTLQPESGYELFNPKVTLSDRLFFQATEERVISLLQIIAKFLRIFTFDFEVVIVGKPTKLLRDALKRGALKSSSEKGETARIEFRLKDGMGRSWVGPMIWHNEKDRVIKSSLFYSLERFVALFLEKSSHSVNEESLRLMRTLRERAAFSIFKGNKKLDR
jgi:hypothetical protein